MSDRKDYRFISIRQAKSIKELEGERDEWRKRAHRYMAACMAHGITKDECEAALAGLLRCTRADAWFGGANYVNDRIPGHAIPFEHKNPHLLPPDEDKA